MANTEKQEKFIKEYVENGGNATDAYKKAGYSAKGADVNGPVLRKKLAAEIEEANREKLMGFAPMALSHLVDLAQNAQSEQVRLKANMDLLDRAGLNKVEKVEQTVTYDDKTTDELKEELRMLLDLEEPVLQ
jgi:phage terminase small subunit